MRTLSLRSAAIGLAAILFMLSASVRAGPTPEQSQPRTQLVGVVNINVAEPAQLELLPGIGPSRARSIVEYRKEHGPFAKVDDLEQVSGIGARALERIRPHCTLNGKTTARLER